MELETLAGDFSEIPAESYDDGSYVDGNGQFFDGESVDEEATLEETEGFQPSESFLLDDIPVDAVVSNDASAMISVHMPDTGNVWHLSVSGIEYYAYFPSDAELENFDGQLVNVGSSSVTALLSSDGSVNVDTYNSFYLTLQPLLTSAGNNNAYRYGSRASKTYYYPGSSSTSLSSTVSYVTVEVLDEPKAGWNFSPGTLVISGLLLFLCLAELIGGMIRR